MSANLIADNSDGTGACVTHCPMKNSTITAERWSTFDGTNNICVDDCNGYQTTHFGAYNGIPNTFNDGVPSTSTQRWCVLPANCKDYSKPADGNGDVEHWANNNSGKTDFGLCITQQACNLLYDGSHYGHIDSLLTWECVFTCGVNYRYKSIDTTPFQKYHCTEDCYVENAVTRRYRKLSTNDCALVSECEEDYSGDDVSGNCVEFCPGNSGNAADDRWSFPLTAEADTGFLCINDCYGRNNLYFKYEN